MSEIKHPVNWFEIPVKDLKRAKAFYEKLFGIPLTVVEMDESKMAMFPMTMGAPGIAGSLVAAPGYEPSKSGTVIYFSVPDIEATLALAEQNGGKTLIPKTNIGQYGFFAHFEDTEGNRLALHTMA